MIQGGMPLLSGALTIASMGATHRDVLSLVVGTREGKICVTLFVVAVVFATGSILRRSRRKPRAAVDAADQVNSHSLVSPRAASFWTFSAWVTGILAGVAFLLSEWHGIIALACVPLAGITIAYGLVAFTLSAIGFLSGGRPGRIVFAGSLLLSLPAFLFVVYHGAVAAWHWWIVPWLAK
jgi:hypothetical protein